MRATSNRDYNGRVTLTTHLKVGVMFRFRLLLLLIVLAAVGCRPQQAAQVPMPTRAVLPSVWVTAASVSYPRP